MKHLISCMAMAFFASSAWAHGSEDHSHEIAPAMVGDVAPRAAAQSEAFELVAVLADGKLTLYLDRYVDNAPVPDAEVEVESGAFKAVAAQVAPGVYSVPGQVFAQPGKHPLTISVQAADAADLLIAALDLALPAAGAEHARIWGEWTVWGTSAVLLLIGAMLLAMRRKKNREG